MGELSTSPSSGDGQKRVVRDGHRSTLGGRRRGALTAALGVVFISGILFFVLSLVPMTTSLLSAVSPSLRSGIAAGVGLFITFLGLRNGGILIQKPMTWVGLNPHSISIDGLIFFAGLLFSVGLYARKIRSGLFWGVALSGVLATVSGKLHFEGIVGFPHVTHSVMFCVDWRTALHVSVLPYVAVFVFMALLDSVGTLMAVGEQAGLIRQGVVPRAKRVLMVDAGASVFGALVGTSTVLGYIESAAVVAVGGRTGFTSVVTGMLFFLPLFFGPLVHTLSAYPPVTAPALVLVGALKTSSVRRIAWDDWTEAFPAFLTLIAIPLTFSISEGLAIGLLSDPLVKLIGGRRQDICWPVVVIAVMILFYFVTVRCRLS